jgi:hypothetical protein
MSKSKTNMRKQIVPKKSLTKPNNLKDRVIFCRQSFQEKVIT